MALEVLSGKLTPEVKEQFQTAQQNSEALTFNAFVELLLEAYLNPKTKQVEVPRPTAEQINEIQLKDNEIGRLKTAYSLIESNNQELQAEILKLTTRNTELETSNAQPKTHHPAPGTIEILLPPIIAKVLEVEAETAKRKSGKEFSFADILLNNFWESIKNGVSHPFRIWSSAELAKVANDLKPVE